ncbi:unnamed protein product [Victoria cruziana]
MKRVQVESYFPNKNWTGPDAYA